LESEFGPVDQSAFSLILLDENPRARRHGSMRVPLSVGREFFAHAEYANGRGRARWLDGFSTSEPTVSRDRGDEATGRTTGVGFVRRRERDPRRVISANRSLSPALAAPLALVVRALKPRKIIGGLARRDRSGVISLDLAVGDGKCCARSDFCDICASAKKSGIWSLLLDWILFTLVVLQLHILCPIPNYTRFPWAICCCLLRENLSRGGAIPGIGKAQVYRGRSSG